VKSYDIEAAARITKLTVGDLVKLDATGIAKATKSSGKLSYTWSQLRRVHRARLIAESGIKVDAVTLKPIKRQPERSPCPVVVLVPHVTVKAQIEAEALFRRGCELEDTPATSRGAEELFRKAIKMNPGDSGSHVHLGRLLLLRKKDIEGEAMLKRALALDPHQSPAAYNLAYLYEDQGDFKLALEYAKHATEVDPGWADGHWRVAECAAKLGLNEQAKRAWVTYIKLSDDDKLKREAWNKVTKLGT